IQGNYFSKNGANGITIFGRSQGEIRENTFENTGFGINIAQQATPMLIGNRITFNKDGVVVQASARPVLRGNYIERNQRDGVVAIAHSLPDLGTSAEPGSNVIRNNGRYDINSTATSEVIPAYGNQLASNRTVGRVDVAGTFRPSALISPLANRMLTNERNGVAPVRNPLPAYNPPSVTPRIEPTATRPLPPAPNRPAPLRRSLPTPLPRVEGQSPIPTGAVEIPVEIPVPTPETTTISPPLRTEAIATAIESSSPVVSPGVLPVPSSSIPVGSGGYVPTGLTASNSSPDRVLSSSVLGLRYRVVVDTQGERDLLRVRSLAPGAFRTFVKGQSVVQAGAFHDREKAETLLQMLVGNGLNARIEEME
ncbi:MAG TPA: right-handed parallel beta-helix repeat-containing protein, partial [Kamptonema sp.]|nr:right-handed parallel beta-helix repeat-containing protein [Kamptonema sp.]